MSIKEDFSMPKGIFGYKIEHEMAIITSTVGVSTTIAFGLNPACVLAGLTAYTINQVWNAKVKKFNAQVNDKYLQEKNQREIETENQKKEERAKNTFLLKSMYLVSAFIGTSFLCSHLTDVFVKGSIEQVVANISCKITAACSLLSLGYLTHRIYVY